jgi:ectoine hydroxylase-related dioxygenase (phytanoyl-CoA dioxygenase family)
MFPTVRRSVSRHGPKGKSNLKISPIWVSDAERNAAQLSHQNIRRSLDEFHRNGLVILENAITHQSIEHVHHRTLEDIGNTRTSPSVRWNQGRNAGNISQSPPSLPEYLHEDIWANRLSVNIMENIIGPRPQLSLATSNIVLPRTTGRQAVHSDYYCNHHDFTVFLEVNIYLHYVDSHNGATEFWLGTHKGYSKDDHSSPTAGWIKREVFTSQATLSPPIQPTISKGSLMIRDLRCWHAGRENQTDEPRIILGFMYSPRWFESQMRMVFPFSARPRLQSWNHIDCLTAANFVTGDFDYLDFHQDINLTPIPLDPTAPYVPKRGSAVVTSRDYWSPP